MPSARACDLSTVRAARKPSKTKQATTRSEPLTVAHCQFKLMTEENAQWFLEVLHKWYPTDALEGPNPITLAERWFGKVSSKTELSRRAEQAWGCSWATTVSRGCSVLCIVLWRPNLRTVRRQMSLTVTRVIGKAQARQGNGRRAMLRFLRDAMQHGYTSVTVEGSQCTEKLWTFYMSCGFQGHDRGPQSSMLLQFDVSSLRSLERMPSNCDRARSERRRLQCGDTSVAVEGCPAATAKEQSNTSGGGVGFASGEEGGAGTGMCPVVSVSQLFQNQRWPGSEQDVMLQHARSLLSDGGAQLRQHLNGVTPNQYGEGVWLEADQSANSLRWECGVPDAEGGVEPSEFEHMMDGVWGEAYGGLPPSRVGGNPIPPEPEVDYCLLLTRVIQEGFFIGDMTMVHAMVNEHTHAAMTTGVMRQPLVVGYVHAVGDALEVTYGGHLSGEAQHGGFIILERWHFRWQHHSPGEFVCEPHTAESVVEGLGRIEFHDSVGFATAMEEEHAEQQDDDDQAQDAEPNSLLVSFPPLHSYLKGVF
jgi:hypothetical protein